MIRHALLAMLAVGCGKEIGDACVTQTDCDPNGTEGRICVDPDTNGGYCTVQGCDYNTCPSEAVCVSFFTGGYANKTCDPATENNGSDACSLDEICAIDGHCVARSSEVRYCMKTCSDDGDCRDGYECRSKEKMISDGGQDVLAPGLQIDDSSPKFCAPAPSS